MGNRMGGIHFGLIAEIQYLDKRYNNAMNRNRSLSVRSSWYASHFTTSTNSILIRGSVIADVEKKPSAL